MALCESKSENSFLNINNIINSFTQEFKRSYNSVRFSNGKKSKKKLNDNKSNNVQKKKESINPSTKDKTINPSATPIEFYYEFQEFIKGGKPIKKKKKIVKRKSDKKKKEIQNENNNEKNDDKTVSKSSSDEEKKNEENESEIDEEEEVNQTENNGLTERTKKSSNTPLNKKSKKNEKNEKKESKIIYRNEDRFWNKVKYYIDLKNEHLNELTYRQKIKRYTNVEENKTNKQLNKSSFLIQPTGRKPLYPYHNINGDFLSKNFDNFYKYYQKEQKVNNYKLYKKKNNQIKSLNYDNSNRNLKLENNFKNYYDKTMKWIKKRDDKINIQRNYLEEKNNKYMNSFSFKPQIDKKSIQLINKRNTFINFMENKPNTERNYHNMMVNKKEIYQKYLATVKPYMAFYYENNSPFLKRSHSFTKRKPTVDIGMIHINKGQNISIIKEKVKSTINSSNKTDTISNKKRDNSNTQSEKKQKAFNEKKNIFNIFKPDKKHLINDNNKIQALKNNLSKSKDKKKKNTLKNQLRQEELKQTKVKKDKKKIDPNDLYKVNVRDNSSWNKICINKIFSKPRDKEVIQDFI